MSKKKKPTKKKLGKVGLAPGAPVFVGEKILDDIRIGKTVYDNETITSKFIGVEKLKEPSDQGKKVWFSVSGLHDVDKILKICKEFDIHSLAVEDLLDTEHRPSIQFYENFILIIFKLYYFDEETKEIKDEQANLVFGENFIISFKESDLPHFKPVLRRLENKSGRIRTAGADYLAFAIADLIIDNYDEVIDKLDERIEKLEEKILNDPTKESIQEIYEQKAEIMNLLKKSKPQTEIIRKLLHEESDLVKDTTDLYLRDLHGQATFATENLESQRDRINSIIELYLSLTNNRMNEVMKFLTLIATIFIPLTFVTGFYGMNFTFMPELDKPWGYPMAIGIMVALGATMYVYFKYKKWL